jgi:oxaloacetate decarboxylase gamma subunit
MSEHSLVTQGLELMVFGMGVVFVFLAMLVVVTNLMSKLVNNCP